MNKNDSMIKRDKKNDKRHRWPHATWEFHLTNKKDVWKLNDVKFLADFLKALPASIGLHVIGKPFMHNFPDKNGVMAEGGITGFVLLSESDITLHTWPEYNYGCIDIFACTNFSMTNAERKIKKTFGKGKYMVDLVYRGGTIPKRKMKRS